MKLTYMSGICPNWHATAVQHNKLRKSKKFRAFKLQRHIESAHRGKVDPRCNACKELSK